VKSVPAKAKRGETSKTVRNRPRHGSGAKAQSAPRNGSERQQTPVEKVNGRVKELLAGAEGGGKKVVASPQAIRKTVRELKEGSSKEDPKGSSAGGVTDAIEEVLGR
jgi:hypothetical protein